MTLPRSRKARAKAREKVREWRKANPDRARANQRRAYYYKLERDKEGQIFVSALKAQFKPVPAAPEPDEEPDHS